MIKLTCAFVSWSDVVLCVHDKVNAFAEHFRLWILNLLN